MSQSIPVLMFLPLPGNNACAYKHTHQGLFQLFAQGGGKMRMYGLLGGQVCICVQSMWQTRGPGGMLPREILILDLLLDAICWNLGQFTIYCVIKPL